MNLFDLPLKDLREYVPQSTMEADFNTFWEKRIEESDGQPLNIKKSQRDDYDYVKNIKVYDVNYDGFRNSRISCTFVTPLEIAVGAPVVVMFHGYNWNSFEVNHTFKYALQGIPVLFMQVRGQSVNANDDNIYKDGAAKGWLTKGIKDKDNYYYSMVYMDCYRAIDVAKELVNTDRVILEGASQGGGLVLATAALHRNVSVALSDVPFLCHFKRAVEVSTEGPYDEIYHYFKLQDPLHEREDEIYSILSYFDCMNLATRIKCPTLISVGLEDTVCPPSTCFAAYNNISSIKDIKVYPEYAHGGMNRHDEEKLKFIYKYINNVK